MDEISFGKYLVRLRNEKSMSQRKLAELAGVANSTISRLESDAVKPDHTTIEKLSVALNVEKSLLLTKCGYSEIPEDFVIIARKLLICFLKYGDLSAEQRAEAYRIISNTMLLEDEDEDEDV
ncbi:MAG: helix-turn-helix domain-containing protein [Eubacteriaceae bacterium]|nr:helix-turn-helix domain-containing protein [Eubacteriaceae bacterium]